jgi:hypothetical protein
MDAWYDNIVHVYLINACQCFNLGALPLSPLHVKALADTEERVEQGHIQSV